MTDLQKLETAVRALDSKKASDIKVLKVEELTILAKYFVIASATSTTQVKALADAVEFMLGENRFAQLESAKPELAKQYRKTLIEQYNARYADLKKMAGKE